MLGPRRWGLNTWRPARQHMLCPALQALDPAHSSARDHAWPPSRPCQLFYAANTRTLPSALQGAQARCREQPTETSSPYRVDDSKYLSMRAEAEAPFRTFRLFLLGFFAISAGIATLFSIPAIIGSVGHAPNAKPLDETAQSLAINLGAPAARGMLAHKEALLFQASIVLSFG